MDVVSWRNSSSHASNALNTFSTSRRSSPGGQAQRIVCISFFSFTTTNNTWCQHT